jgi:hypothetical protein
MSEETLRTNTNGEVEAEAALERRSPVHPYEVARAVGGVITDIRAIADGMSVLPKLLGALTSIEARVNELNDEVAKMRASVDTMAGDVNEVRGGIDRLEPHLEDVNKMVHPLRRLGDRARRRDEDLAP